MALFFPVATISLDPSLNPGWLPGFLDSDLIKLRGHREPAAFSRMPIKSIDRIQGASGGWSHKGRPWEFAQLWGLVGGGGSNQGSGVLRWLYG